jgi:hypothetical protein
MPDPARISALLAANSKKRRGPVSTSASVPAPRVTRFKPSRSSPSSPANSLRARASAGKSPTRGPRDSAPSWVWARAARSARNRTLATRSSGRSTESSSAASASLIASALVAATVAADRARCVTDQSWRPMTGSARAGANRGWPVLPAARWKRRFPSRRSRTGRPIASSDGRALARAASIARWPRSRSLAAETTSAAETTAHTETASVAARTHRRQRRRGADVAAVSEGAVTRSRRRPWSEAGHGPLCSPRGSATKPVGGGAFVDRYGWSMSRVGRPMP